jgi:predicted nucleic-acid-binding Zn-ribbon protein
MINTSSITLSHKDEFLEKFSKSSSENLASHDFKNPEYSFIKCEKCGVTVYYQLHKFDDGISIDNLSADEQYVENNEIFSCNEVIIKQLLE